MQLPLYKTLPNGIQVELDEMTLNEHEAVRLLFNQIIHEGMTYPQNQPLTVEEFALYWTSWDAFVVKSAHSMDDLAPGKLEQLPEEELPEILGSVYLKPNFPGRSSHICNAGFIVHPAMQGQGIGRWMGEVMLAIAPTIGYTAVMFNLVFATNVASLKIWNSLGFTQIGRIPNAAQLANGELVDAVMLYHSLENV